MANMPPADSSDLDRVFSFRDWCLRVGISEATGRRMLRAGLTPKITKLSERRFGIRERHHREWLDSRASESTAAA
jgi:hypothetical protein